jgi:hypothetical protein
MMQKMAEEKSFFYFVFVFPFAFFEKTFFQNSRNQKDAFVGKEAGLVACAHPEDALHHGHM